MIRDVHSSSFLSSYAVTFISNPTNTGQSTNFATISAAYIAAFISTVSTAFH